MKWIPAPVRDKFRGNDPSSLRSVRQAQDATPRQYQLGIVLVLVSFFLIFSAKASFPDASAW